MKALLSALIVLTSLNLHAEDLGKYVCQQYDRKTDEILRRTVVLTQNGPAREKLNEIGEYEYMEAPYYLEIYNGTEAVPAHTVRGKVASEDVHFFFSSNDGKVSFRIYLDEMEESVLTLGENRTDYFCR